MFDHDNQPVLGSELTAKLTALEHRFDAVAQTQGLGLQHLLEPTMIHPPPRHAREAR